VALRARLLIALTAFVFSGIILGAQAPPGSFPGSSHSVTDAVSSATDIAIVKFTNIGWADHAAAERLEYGHVKIRILDNLKGTNTKRIELGDTGLGYTLFRGESLPNLSDAYILTLGPGIIKIIPATKDNIEIVKKLMAKFSSKY
jgi:hypothetical protein